VRPLSPEELSGRLVDQVLWVFSGALGFPRRHSRVLGFADTLRRHAAYPGVLAFGAFNLRSRLVGFSYGYTSQPGLWWRNQVTAAMTADQIVAWFGDAFEFCELHVHPAHQGQHLGSRLHDQLVAGLPNKTAILSVMHRSERARQLYFSRGWQTVIDTLLFSSDPTTPFSVLGLAL
jgi:ribosomal protein S18 acetylase RimI-like enzyme